MQARNDHDEPIGPDAAAGGNDGAAMADSAAPGSAPAVSESVKDPAAAGRGGWWWRFGWFEASFLTVIAVALGLRLWELGGRTMHYDEAIHLHFAFKLANSPGAALGWPWIFGADYVHSAWMHGPFQIEMAAAIFTLLGDSDFTSRLGYVLFGTALTALPWLLRGHLGRRGALIAAIMLALSPALLYFSRFGRNDIIMMFWAVSLFVLMWRYISSAVGVRIGVRPPLNPPPNGGEIETCAGERAAGDKKIAAGAGERAGGDKKMAACAGERATGDRGIAACGGERRGGDGEIVAYVGERAAGDGERAACAGERAANDGEIAACAGERAASDGEIAACDKERAGGDGEIAACAVERAGGDGEMADDAVEIAAYDKETADDVVETAAGGGDAWAGRRSCLYLAAAALALMFATKETAYLLAAIFGVMALAAALPELLAWARWRRPLAREGTPLAALLLLVTLTLPQWSAGLGLLQGPLGLTLANPDPLTGNNVPNADGGKGLTGAPAWEGATLPLPLADVPWPAHVAVAVAALLALLWLASRGPLSRERLAGLVGLPLLSAVAGGWLVFRPFSGADYPVLPAADWVVIALSVTAAIGCALWSRYRIRPAALLLGGPALLAALYALLFTPALDLPAVVNAMLPGGATLAAGDAGAPVNYAVAAAMLLGTLVVSAAAGIWWLGRVWLICAAIFYSIWAALYTTLFTNISGIFTGSWQGMGYWIAQQDVARGNQPWYYYFIGLSVYELLPLVFGLAGAVYFYRRRDALGLALCAWAALSLAAYTVATEKMPWLLVNITTPFILAAAKFLGHLADAAARGGASRYGRPLTAILLLLTPLIAGTGVYLFLQFIDPARPFGAEHWLLLASIAAAALVAAYVYRISGRIAAPAAGFAPATGAVALGIAALLLGLGVWGAFRAAYTYDDSNVEVMVYAQGAADLRATYRMLEQEIYPLPDGVESVKSDYDLWYQLQWYVRDHTRDGRMSFRCFKADPEEDANCIVLSASQEDDGGYDFGNPGGLLVKDAHAGNDGAVRESYRREGPFRNLLWFPETYRRPHENREEEAMSAQLVKDFQFFGEVAGQRESWADALDYVLFRRLDTAWFSSNYYSYLP